MLSAYKVRNKDGLFARAAFKGWSKRGKSWAARNHLNAAITNWLDQRKWLHPDGVYRPGQTPASPIHVPADWVVVELTIHGIKEYSARAFYREKRKS